jgi:hypothetical protein
LLFVYIDRGGALCLRTRAPVPGSIATTEHSSSAMVIGMLPMALGLGARSHRRRACAFSRPGPSGNSQHGVLCGDNIRSINSEY